MSSSRRSRGRKLRQVIANVFVALLALVALLLLVGLFLPRGYHVERSLVIHARPQALFADLATPRRWPEWTVWNREMDPTAEFRFDGPESGADAAYSWTGQKLGQGRLKIVSASPTNGVAYLLEFENGKFVSEGSLHLEPAGEDTRVVWSNEGDLGKNPVNRYMGLMIDSMLGPQFEQSLGRLKTRAEAAPQ